MREEFRHLSRLALPVVATQVGSMTMGTVDTIMVGRLGVQELAAAAVANAWIWAVILAGQGLVHGIDPVVAQAHGAGRGDLAGRALQRGIAIAGCAGLVLGSFWFWTEDALVFLGQDPSLARLAHDYTVVQSPSLVFFFAFVALRQYLQGREIMRPAMWVTLVANVFNVGANYILIFGALGIPGYGLVGAGVATALSRIFMFALLAAWVWRARLYEGAWTPWRWSSLDPRELAGLLAIGIPVAIQMSLEVWAFSTATLIAGRLGSVEVAAHTIVLNMAALAFMMPLGISHAAVTRVGNLIGAHAPDAAQRAARVALLMGAGVMTLSAVTFVALRYQLPYIYTPDASVVAACALILPIAGAFQIFDGIQAVGGGVLRAMGRTRPAAAFNLVGYWLIGLPLGGYAALNAGWGLEGLWWGLCLGLALIACSFVAWIHWRGPAHVTESVI